MSACLVANSFAETLGERPADRLGSGDLWRRAASSARATAGRQSRSSDAAAPLFAHIAGSAALDAGSSARLLLRPSARVHLCNHEGPKGDTFMAISVPILACAENLNSPPPL